MNELNYAKVYSDQLAQAFPYALNFGALYATPNNGRYRFKGGKTIEIPVINTTGRTDANRDSVNALSRNYENQWEEFELTNQRKWSTLIHPSDVDQTNYAATIANITSVFNNEHKFPEMDAYTVSKIYADWTDLGKSKEPETIDSDNVISIFDLLMSNMTEARVPVNGRILYVTPEVMMSLKNATEISRSFDIKNGGDVNRSVTTLDGVPVIEVPSSLMKTSYDFSDGCEADVDAGQIGMLLIHPESVITPVSYEFACLDEPSAATGGKYVYYEESYEDVFILPRRVDGVSFVLSL
ncbi:MAG: capsid protein [Clostridia bacterium]|nr:capsid protein [Clostridia bacterium]